MLFKSFLSIIVLLEILPQSLQTVLCCLAVIVITSQRNDRLIHLSGTVCVTKLFITFPEVQQGFCKPVFLPCEPVPHKCKSLRCFLIILAHHPKLSNPELCLCGKKRIIHIGCKNIELSHRRIGHVLLPEIHCNLVSALVAVFLAPELFRNIPEYFHRFHGITDCKPYDSSLESSLPCGVMFRELFLQFAENRICSYYLVHLLFQQAML